MKVLLMAYEWRRQSAIGATLPFDDQRQPPASKEELIGLFEHLEGVLDTTGFFTSADKRPSMVHNLRTMLSRGQFTAQEVRTLRGVVSSIDLKHKRPRRKTEGEV